jgi:hypothetical protein
MLMKRRPPFVEFLERAKNNEEDRSNRYHENEVKQHGSDARAKIAA